MPIIKDAFDSLAAENDIIVIEGAGSPAEINLKQDDIVNMGLAKLVDAPVLLVGDIDRGGVFASLYGTVKLLEEDEQARIRGLIINKFRGDVEILRPGLTQLEDLTGKPVIGVVPYGHFDIDDEDSLSERLDTKGCSRTGKHCGCKAAATVQFYRFFRTFACIRRECRVRGQTGAACRSRPDYPAGHQVHAGRPAVAARERHGGADSQGARSRYAGFRHLRRLPDDGTHGLRPGQYRRAAAVCAA